MDDRLERVGYEVGELVLVEGQLSLADFALPGVVCGASVAKDDYVLDYIIDDDRVGRIVI